MGRPSQIEERRRELLPIISGAFAKLGYRRATTAQLAEHCGVRENILYRIWEDKRALFLAAIDYLYEKRMQLWQRLAECDDTRTGVEQMLDFEAAHLGEGGFHRILFAALTETDDPEIRAALRRMYGGYHTVLAEQIELHNGAERKDADVTAWAAIGLVTILNILNELNMMNAKDRKSTFLAASRLLLQE